MFASVPILLAEEETWLETLVGWAWGMPLVFLVLGSGLLFTIVTRFVQFRHAAHATALLAGRYDDPDDPGEISHFQALSAALSATIGLGNIAGVAIAISKGGPGAVFWMWMAALVGMATKYTSCLISNRYRFTDDEGHAHGGPMYSIERGIGKDWAWLAVLFAVCTVAASVGAGNMFQANQSAQALEHYYGVPPMATGLVLAALVALVIIGGIKRIGQVASKIVPFMCLVYLLGATWICLMHASELPGILQLILTDAWTGQAAVGGAVGEVIRQGVRRGVFSNEAGLGSAPIAHAVGKTKEPAREGLVAMLGPAIDTIIVCTMTASVIIIAGLFGTDAEIDDRLAELRAESPVAAADLGIEEEGEVRDEREVEEEPYEERGVVLTAEAFGSNIPGFGKFMVALAVCLFAFSTAISWSYYGETALYYLAGGREAITLAYKVIFVALILVGALWTLGPVLNISDILFALMAVPNLIACIILSPEVGRRTREYGRRLRAGEFHRDREQGEGPR